MQFGFFSGLLWGLDTVILGIGLALAPILDRRKRLHAPPLRDPFSMMPSVQSGSLATWELEAD